MERRPTKPICRLLAVVEVVFLTQQPKNITSTFMGSQKWSEHVMTGFLPPALAASS